MARKDETYDMIDDGSDKKNRKFPFIHLILIAVLIVAGVAGKMLLDKKNNNNTVNESTVNQNADEIVTKKTKSTIEKIEEKQVTENVDVSGTLPNSTTSTTIVNEEKKKDDIQNNDNSSKPDGKDNVKKTENIDKKVSEERKNNEIQTNNNTQTVSSKPTEIKSDITKVENVSYEKKKNSNMVTVPKGNKESVIEKQIVNENNEKTKKVVPLDSESNSHKIVLFFDTNKYELRDSDKNIIKKFVEKFNEKDGFGLEIKGYADTDGEEEHNIILSKKRADMTKQEIVNVIEKENQNCIARGEGETNIFGDNSTTEGKAKNRRVEIVVIKK